MVTGEPVPDEPWVERHSVTCAICGGLADERRTVDFVTNAADEYPTLEQENPLRLVAINTAVNESGEGETHEACLQELETYLVWYGGRLSEELTIDERNHR